MHAKPSIAPGAILRGAVWLLLTLNALWALGWTLVVTWQVTHEPSPRLREALAAAAVSPDFYFAYHVVAILITFGCFFAVAQILFLRRPDDRLAVFSAVFLLGLGAASANPSTPEFWELIRHPDRFQYVISDLVNNLLAWPLLVVFFAVYPDGVFVPRWMRYVALYVFFFSLGWGLFPDQFDAPQGGMIIFVSVSVIIAFGGALYAQVYRYRRHAGPAQRQQIKWMVYGFAFVALVISGQQILFTRFGALSPAEQMAMELLAMAITASFVIVPISLGVAILRYRLFDIDVIIRRTVIYSLLTALLALAYFGSIVLLQQLFTRLTGQQSAAAIVVSTLGIAALFNPLRRRVQDGIDRRFYRRKYDAEKALAAFAATARDETDLDALTAALLATVHETVQPERASVWLARNEKR